MMRRGSISSLCALLLWMGGCPKRQETRSVVVYVPAQAPAAASAAQAAPPSSEPKMLVIEEPSPAPEPDSSASTQGTQPQPKDSTPHRSPKRQAHPEAQAEPDETTPQENPEPPAPAQIPALEPRESTAEEGELRRQYQRLELDLRQRLTRLESGQLSPNDRRTLEDARAFFDQATAAMTGGDTSRALNLARKASLLLTALE